ncbi:class I lanthipeptide [Taibaiella chishuiensis]|uniref:Natural product n=1 Tax=Taibaiella chishuiensis TaxID=1434707 RepID=A0A2P8DBY9_9BACT|nr:class I lanthipeptide [Taibaiella chishuiensis]PSK94722.1 hypothetical protein B0I18_101882 [Taibaiella chishuiensis]
MKRKTLNLSGKLTFSKATLAALNNTAQNNILGGASLHEGCVVATHNDNCRTLGLGIDLTQCCPVYEVSVNIACAS